MSTDAAYYRKVLPAPRQRPGRPKTKKIIWAEHHGDVKAKALHPLPGFRTGEDSIFAYRNTAGIEPSREYDHCCPDSPVGPPVAIVDRHAVIIISRTLEIPSNHDINPLCFAAIP